MNPILMVRRLPRRAQLMLLANAVNSFGAGLVLPFLVIYLARVRGMDIRVPALALTVTGVCALVTVFAWGSLMDRWSYRGVVLVVMLTAGAGTSLYAVASTPLLACLAGAVYGIGIGGVGTVTRALFATVVGGPDRTAVYGLEFTLHNVFVGAGMVVGGLVAQSLTVGHYAALYLADGGTFLLAGIGIALLLPPAAKPALDGIAQAPARALGGYRSVLADRRLRWLIAIVLVGATLSYGQFESGLPAYLTLRNAVGPAGLAAAFVVNVVVIAIAQVAVMPRLAGRSRTAMITLSGIAASVCWLLVLLAGLTTGAAALTWLVLAVVLFSVGEVLLTPITAAMVNDLATDELRGRYNALFSFAISFAAFAGPALAGALLPVGRGVALMVLLIGACLMVPAGARQLRRLLPPALDRTAPADPTDPAAPSADPATPSTDPAAPSADPAVAPAGGAAPPAPDAEPART